MKKILLCTTALVGFAASAFAAEGASDSAMALSFHGSSKFEVGTKSQDRNHKTSLAFSPNQKSTGFFTSQRASLKAEGKSDSLTYGAVMRLQTVGNMSSGMSDARNDRSHIYLDTDMGAVQLGSNFAASKLMQIDASTIASATGGIDGDFTEFASTIAYDEKSSETVTYNSQEIKSSARAASVASSMMVTGVDTVSNKLDGRTGEQSRKVTYLSPRISGLQLGVSFSPDFNNTGNNDITGKNKEFANNMYMGLPVRLKNVWSMGLNYTNTFNDVNVAFAAVADRGTAVKQNFTYTENSVTKTEQTKFHNLNTYSLGLVVGTNGFSVAGSYHNDGKSLTEQASGEKFSSSWWTAGVAYENGPMSTSLTYLQGKKKQDTTDLNGKAFSQNVKSQIVSLGADYEVAPGLKPFAEVSMVKYKPQTQYVSGYDSNNAKATVFLLGTKVKF